VSCCPSIPAAPAASKKSSRGNGSGLGRSRSGTPGIQRVSRGEPARAAAAARGDGLSHRLEAELRSNRERLLELTVLETGFILDHAREWDGAIEFLAFRAPCSEQHAARPASAIRTRDALHANDDHAAPYQRWPPWCRRTPRSLAVTISRPLYAGAAS